MLIALHCVAVSRCCSVLQCHWIAWCCGVLQCVNVFCIGFLSSSSLSSQSLHLLFLHWYADATASRHSPHTGSSEAGAGRGSCWRESWLQWEWELVLWPCELGWMCYQHLAAPAAACQWVHTKLCLLAPSGCLFATLFTLSAHHFICCSFSSYDSHATAVLCFRLSPMTCWLSTSGVFSLLA